MRAFPFVLLAAWLIAPVSFAAEHRVASPGGQLSVVVTDDGGLHYRVEVGGQAVVVASPLGLGFKDGTNLGPSATITKATSRAHDGSWRNPFGNRSVVPDQPSGSDAQAVIESTRAVDSSSVLRLALAPGGGFAGIISESKTKN